MKQMKRWTALILALVLVLALVPGVSAADTQAAAPMKPDLPALPGQFTTPGSSYWHTEGDALATTPTFSFSRQIPDQDLWYQCTVKIYQGGVMRADQDSYMLLWLQPYGQSGWLQYAPGDEAEFASYGIHVVPTEQTASAMLWDQTIPARIYGAGYTFRFDKAGTYTIYVGTADMNCGLITVQVVEPTATARATQSQVMVNGQAVGFEAYTINGNNYFKLRDIAQVLSGSEKQFEVTWDGAKSAINLVSGQAYTSVGGELQPGDGTTKTAKVCQSVIYQDGKEAAVFGFTINGNNYFKLRDLGAAFDFGVSWDAANSCVMIDTSTGYTPE